MFFGKLGIPWEHEPEGYETSAGRYLPDFRIQFEQPELHESSAWFEVKPEGGPSDGRHLALARESGTPVIVARGMPHDYNGQFLRERSALQVITPDGGVTPCGFVAGVASEWIRPFGINPFYCGLGDNRHWCQEHFGESMGDAPHLAIYCESTVGDSPMNSRAVTNAYTAARSERFGR